MKIRVLLFAAARQLVGHSEVEIELARSSAPTIGQLRTVMQRDFPELIGLLAVSTFAINSDWCSDDATISEDSQVAMIPPVSGG